MRSLSRLGLKDAASTNCFCQQSSFHKAHPQQEPQRCFPIFKQPTLKVDSEADQAAILRYKMNYYGSLASHQISNVLDLSECLVPLVQRPKAAVNHSNLRLLVCRDLASSDRDGVNGPSAVHVPGGPLLVLQGATLFQSSPQSHNVSCAGGLAGSGRSAFLDLRPFMFRGPAADAGRALA